MRHVGWVFVAWVVALLWSGAEWRGWRAAMLYAVLAVQVIAGVRAVVGSARHEFSGGLAAADYLKQQGLAAAPMVFAPDYVSLPVLAYLERPRAYYVERHAPGSIVVWDKAEWYGRHIPSRQELLAAGDAPVLVTEKPLSADEMQGLGVKKLAEFDGEIEKDRYFMYR